MDYNYILNYLNDEIDGLLLIYPISKSTQNLKKNMAKHNQFYINLNSNVLKIQIIQSLENCPSCIKLKNYMFDNGFDVICEDNEIKKLIKNEYNYNTKRFNVFLIIKKGYLKKNCQIL